MISPKTIEALAKPFRSTGERRVLRKGLSGTSRVFGLVISSKNTTTI